MRKERTVFVKLGALGLAVLMAVGILFSPSAMALASDSGNPASGEPAQNDLDSMTEHTVTLSVQGLPEGVSPVVQLGGQEAGALTADTLGWTVTEGETYTLELSAPEGYGLSGLTIGAQPKDVPKNRDSVTLKDLSFAEDTAVEITFVRLYSVQVTYDSEKGEVTVDEGSVSDKGSVWITPSETDNFQLKAEPKGRDKYRVASVEVKTQALGDDTWTEGTTETFSDNGKSYEQFFTKDRNYQFTIVFAGNLYQVVSEDCDNGEIKIENVDSEGRAEYGSGKVIISVTPASGYGVSSVSISSGGNETTLTDDNVSLAADGTVRYEIDSETLCADLTVSAVCGETSNADSDKSDMVSVNTASAVRTDEDNRRYVYGKDVSAAVSCQNENGSQTYPIRVNGKMGEAEQPHVCKVSREDGGEVYKITDIALRYAADGEALSSWHPVADVSDEQPITIIFDESGPSIKANVSKDYTAFGGYYSENITIDVTALDGKEGEQTYSGIKEIAYCVYDGAFKGPEGIDYPQDPVLYQFNEGDEISQKVELTGKKGVAIEAAAHTGDVYVAFRVTDLAGNVSYATYPEEGTPLKFYTSPPEMTITFSADEPSARENDGGREYYQDAVTAEVAIRDREATFDDKNATAWIKNNIRAVNAAGAEVRDVYTIEPADTNGDNSGDWTETVENGETYYKAKVTFGEDANYTWNWDTVDEGKIYKNKAGLVNVGSDRKATVEVMKKNADGEPEEIENPCKAFTVDREAPSSVEIGVENPFWHIILETITFGAWSSSDIEITGIEAEDETSGVGEIAYYTQACESDDEKYLTVEELEEAYQKEKFESIDPGSKDSVLKLKGNGRYVVYVRVADKAGNAVYYCTDGKRVDKLAPDINLSLPMADYVRQADGEEEEEWYYGDKDGNVEIKTEITDGVYSGVKRITYAIEAGSYDEETKQYEQSEKHTYTLNSEGNLVDDDNNKWTGSIKVDAGKYNYSNVRVTVSAEDVAGNISNGETRSLNICAEKPEMTITFSAAEPSAREEDDGREYYLSARMAEVVIRDRENTFDVKNATAWIENNISAINAAGGEVEDAYTIEPADANGDNSGDWTKTVEGDGTYYKAKVTFSKDANYTWDWDTVNEEEIYKNKAGRANVDGDGNATVKVMKRNADDEPESVENPCGDFTVDREAAEITLDEESNDGKPFWYKVLDDLVETIKDKIGPWIKLDSNNRDDSITIGGITAEDETSGVGEIAYYRQACESDDEEYLTVEELEEAYQNKKFESADPDSRDSILRLKDNGRYVVYVRVADKAGNVAYACTNGQRIDKEVPAIKLTLPETDCLYEKNKKTEGWYNNNNNRENVELEVEISDQYSGVKQITYAIEAGAYDTETEQYEPSEEHTYTLNSEGKLVDYNNNEIWTFDSEKDVWKGKIVVDTQTYNYSNVKVMVTAFDAAETDNSGNTVEGNRREAEVSLNICMDQPEITVTSSDSPSNTAGDRKYYQKKVTAEVVIKDREDTFEADRATAWIKNNISAVNAAGDKVKDAYTIEPADANGEISGDWTKTVENGETYYKAKVTFSKDANYTWDWNSKNPEKQYKNKAGLYHSISNSTNFYEKFTVDKTVPTGKITATSAENSESPLISDKGMEKTDQIGRYSAQEIKVQLETADETSGVASWYFLSDKNYSEAQLSELESSNWTTFNGSEKKPFSFSVKPNREFVVYVKLEDTAGNVKYLSSRRMIVDAKHPLVEYVSPEITVTPQQPINGIYHQDVAVDISVTDPTVGGTYSGLQEIKYKVISNGVETLGEAEQTLYSQSVDSAIRGPQVYARTVTVNSVANNSNNVVVRVEARDMAGNYTYEETSIQIDITSPTIDVAYDGSVSDSGNFYKDGRTAYITVTERNFDPNLVNVSVTNTDGTMPAMSEWQTVPGIMPNGDDTKHTMTVSFYADGDYTFSVNCQDVAGNVAGPTNYGGENPSAFTVDKTAPVVSVSYDNNSAQNGKYFNSGRTATVTVREHNFDVGRVEFPIIATLSGTPIAVPGASWSHDGDVHTATIAFGADGDYTMDVRVRDKAGNASGAVDYGGSVAGNEFTVDQSYSDIVRVEGVENGQVLGLGGDGSIDADATIRITFQDVNLQSYQISLARTRVLMNAEDSANLNIEDHADVTGNFVANASGSGNGTVEFNISRSDEDGVSNDGLYELTVTANDMAGNAYDSGANVLVFSVNRYGSVYTFNEALRDLAKEGGAYTQAVDETLIIREYNPNALTSASALVTKDSTQLSGVRLSRDVLATEQHGTDMDWYEYAYELPAENFSQDGVYKITVASHDTAEHNPENINYENLGILFRVDSTAPEITSVTGLNRSIVNADSLDVSFEMFDAIGLKSVDIYVDDNKVRSADNFEDIVHYSDAITLKEGANQHVRMVVEDLAGNVMDTDGRDSAGNYSFNPAYDFFRDITVSTNVLIRWYANKPLFFGSIAGTVALIGGGVIIFRKRRRKKA